MDAVQPMSQKQIEGNPDSPSTLVPPSQYDCEAAVNEPERHRRSYSVPLLNLFSKTYKTPGTWRKIMGIREPKMRLDWEDAVITRKRKEFVTIPYENA